jgi:hypothetical protein
MSSGLKINPERPCCLLVACEDSIFLRNFQLTWRYIPKGIKHYLNQYSPVYVIFVLFIITANSDCSRVITRSAQYITLFPWKFQFNHNRGSSSEYELLFRQFGGFITSIGDTYDTSSGTPNARSCV